MVVSLAMGAAKRAQMVAVKLGQLEHVAFGIERTQPALRPPIQRADVLEAQLRGDAAAGGVFTAGPQRETLHIQGARRPIDEGSARFGGQALSGTIGADPVMQLGRAVAVTIQSGDTKHCASALLDQAEMELGVVIPI